MTFHLGGTAVGVAQSPHYTARLDTTQLADGVHTVKVVAVDADGRIANTSAVMMAATGSAGPCRWHVGGCGVLAELVHTLPSGPEPATVSQSDPRSAAIAWARTTTASR